MRSGETVWNSCTHTPPALRQSVKLAGTRFPPNKDDFNKDDDLLNKTTDNVLRLVTRGVEVYCGKESC